MSLKSAYLQIPVGEQLWLCQLVEYNGLIYCLARLGFGLSSASKIMTAVLKMVLTKDNTVKRVNKLLYRLYTGRRSIGDC